MKKTITVFVILISFAAFSACEEAPQSNDQSSSINLDAIPRSTLIGKVVTLKAVNNNYVSADNDGSILIANKTSAGDDEKFEIFDAGDNRISLMCIGNGKYVCAENKGQNPLAANRDSVGSWEKFIIQESGNAYGFIARANSKYVCAERGGSEPLIANRSRMGSWETFNLEIVSDIPGDTYTVITSPSNGSVFQEGETINVAVDAEDPDGVNAVRLWINGAYHSIDTDLPYTFTVSGLTPGTYSLMARARDVNGEATDSEEISITVEDGGGGVTRTVITSPSNSSVFQTGETINVAVDAEDPDGVSAVRLWINGSYHSIDTDSPYTFSVSGLTPGTYSLMARARDVNGESTDSAEVSITIEGGGGTGDPLKIVIFSVRSGDAALIVFPDKKIMMVDTGTESMCTARVIPFFENNGVSHLDYFVNTHDHPDHRGCYNKLVNQGYITGSTTEWNNKDFNYEDQFNVEGTEWFIYNVFDRDRYGTDANANSLSFRMEYNGFIYSASGDEDDRSQNRFLNQHPGLVKAHVRNTAHHMWGPVSQNFLKATDPYLFIVSCYAEIRSESSAFRRDFLGAVNWLNNNGGRLMEYAITGEEGHVYIHANSGSDWGYEYYSNIHSAVIPDFP